MGRPSHYTHTHTHTHITLCILCYSDSILLWEISLNILYIIIYIIVVFTLIFDLWIWTHRSEEAFSWVSGVLRDTAGRPETESQPHVTPLYLVGLGDWARVNSFIFLKGPYFTPFWDLIWGIGPRRRYFSGFFPCPLSCLSGAAERTGCFQCSWAPPPAWAWLADCTLSQMRPGLSQVSFWHIYVHTQLRVMLLCLDTSAEDQLHIYSLIQQDVSERWATPSSCLFKFWQDSRPM